MIFNLETHTPDLPEGWTPLEAVAVVKCLDENGVPSFVIRITKGLSGWECYGLLELAAKHQAKDILDHMESDE